MQDWLNIQKSINVIHDITKEENPMNIPIPKIAFDKIQHLFIIKTLNKLGMESNFLNWMKGMYISTQNLQPTSMVKD